MCGKYLCRLRGKNANRPFCPLGNTACVSRKDRRPWRQTYLNSDPDLPFTLWVRVTWSPDPALSSEKHLSPQVVVKMKRESPAQQRTGLPIKVRFLLLSFIGICKLGGKVIRSISAFPRLAFCGAARLPGSLINTHSSPSPAPPPVSTWLVTSRRSQS